MLIENTLFGTRDKVAEAIQRLKSFEPKNEPYIIAFSGGKDSVCILALAKIAGVKYEAVYNVTSVDPPELVRFIKEKYPEVRREIPHDKNGKPITMWTLLKTNPMPPTQIARYCCKYLKEQQNTGRVTITGVRWAESVNRKKNQGVATITGKNASKKDALIGVNFTSNVRGGVVLNDDNDESRRAVEACYRTHKTLINPIIDWTDEDVWEFIHKYNVPYCELYDNGMKRLGCIGCPMGNRKGMIRDFEKYPKYKDEYIRCFDVMARRRKVRGLRSKNDWETGQDIFNWWIREVDNRNIDLTLFQDEEDGTL